MKMMTAEESVSTSRAHRHRHRHRVRQGEHTHACLSSLLMIPLVLQLLLIGTSAAAAAGGGSCGATTTTFKWKTSSVKYAIDKSGGGKGSDEDRHWSRRALDAVLSSINSEDDAETTASRTVFDVVRGRARVSSGDSLVDSSSGKRGDRKEARRNKKRDKRSVPAAATAEDAPSSMFGWRRREADPSDVSRAKPKAVPVDDSEKTYFERIGRRIAERIERTKDVVCKPAF